MPQIVSVPTNIDSSSKLQALIDKIGNTPTEYVFSEDNEIEVSSPIRIYPSCVVSGNGMTFRLKDKVPTSIFPTMTPILGAKKSGGDGYYFSGLCFDGNSNNQLSSTGKGFHNFIGLTNATNISIRGCHIHDTLGDGARLTNVKNVTWEGNRVLRCGHDGLYADGGENVEALWNYTELRTNSAIRYRHVQNGYIHHNTTINNVSGQASSPGFQIENSTAGRSSSNIIIENNTTKNTFGPGIWVIGTVNTVPNAASGLTIQNNIFDACGQMRHISGVGGIVCDGWDNVSIQKNEFTNCMGYGVLFGKYVNVTSMGQGYLATVQENRFVGTKKGYVEGTASGTALCNTIPTKYAVEARGNIFSGNFNDLYNVSEMPAVQEPQEPSEPSVPSEPLGSRPTLLEINCSDSQFEELQKNELFKNILYKRL